MSSNQPQSQNPQKKSSDLHFIENNWKRWLKIKIYSLLHLGNSFVLPLFFILVSYSGQHLTNKLFKKFIKPMLSGKEEFEV